MKKLILVLLAIFLATPAFAGKKATTKNLTVNNVVMSSYAIADGVTVTSDSVYQAGNVGFNALIANVSGNITISYQVSKDASSWYTPYTTDGTTLTAGGSIVSGLTANRWIILTARLAPYIRFSFTSSGASTVTSSVVWQDEN